MTDVVNKPESIGINYPTTTGRLKEVKGKSERPIQKVAIAGDSTADSGHWVEKDKPYAEKTKTITHQTATALVRSNQSDSYLIGNFAIDGATTNDLLRYCPLDKVLNADEDHPSESPVHQLKSIEAWQPDIVVLSVAGNNYREALRSTLIKEFAALRGWTSEEELEEIYKLGTKFAITAAPILFRKTPESVKEPIKKVFQEVKEKLLSEYKTIIDHLIANNPNLKRIVLVSQYFPAITEFTPYMIYTGFSHVSRADGKGNDAFAAVEETMNELYREVLRYASEKDKEVVFADVTSSLNPLNGNHTHQIEPDGPGARVMGTIIANAIEYEFPTVEQKDVKNPIAVVRLKNEKEPHFHLLTEKDAIDNFKVKKINAFISESRYRHLGLLFSPNSSLNYRFENAYHLVMGKQFDAQYTGLFAFGLLDVSLVTIMASYLWRVALNDNLPTVIQATAGIVAAPVLLAKMIVGLALLAVLALPIYGLHQALSDDVQAVEETESSSLLAPA